MTTHTKPRTRLSVIEEIEARLVHVERERAHAARMHSSTWGDLAAQADTLKWVLKLLRGEQ